MSYNNSEEEEFITEDINWDDVADEEKVEDLQAEVDFNGYIETSEDLLEEGENTYEVDDFELEDGIQIEEDLDIEFEDELLDETETNIDEEENGILVNLDGDTNLDELVDDIDDSEDKDNGVKYNANGDIVVVSDTVEDLEFKTIDISSIIIPKRVRKVTQDSVKSMVRAIKTNGLLTPIVVSPIVDGDNVGKYYLIDGYRRLVACHVLSKKSIISVINPNIKNTHNLLVEALYNHNIKYNISEIIEYTKKLEDELGITNVNTIEYLLQMDIGNYTKLKDVLRDNDPDIIEKLLSGAVDIPGAYKKVEARRKKETKEQQQDKLSKEATSENLGDLGTIGSLTDVESETVELNDLNNEGSVINSNGESSLKASNLEDVDNMDLDEVMEESDNARLTKDTEQMSGERERLDPSLRKAVLARDNHGCQICKKIVGSAYVDVLDIHHILPVFLNKQEGGISKDNMDNLVTACTVCHKLIHLDAQDKVHFDINDDTSKEEKDKIKRIKMLSKVIKDGVTSKGLTIKDLKELDKDVERIGRSFGRVDT